LWGLLAKSVTRPEPEPPRRKQKEKTDRGILRTTAAALIRRVARRAVTTIAARLAAFGHAAIALTAREIEAPPCEPLDAANPYWDFSFDSDADFAQTGAGLPPASDPC
jgi:hypothetical protein